jgi:hypothetical protein
MSPRRASIVGLRGREERRFPRVTTVKKRRERLVKSPRPKVEEKARNPNPNLKELFVLPKDSWIDLKQMPMVKSLNFFFLITLFL